MVGIGRKLERVTAIVPATLIVLFVGLLWLIGLFCGNERRTYVVKVTDQATATIRSVLSGPRQQTWDEITPEQPDTTAPALPGANCDRAR
jgi:hypothetical protein